MKLLRLAAVAVLLCAPLAANAQTVRGSSRLDANTAVVDVPGTGPGGEGTVMTQGIVLINPATGVPYVASGGGGSSGPLAVVATDKSGNITTGGVAQTAIAANASRKGWCIMNPPTATEVLQVRSGATATTTTGFTISAGGQACSPSGIVDVALVSVLAATTNHAWMGVEYQ